MTAHNGSKLRSQAWWDNSENPDMTVLYLERFCNRHHFVLFVVTGGEREGLRTARIHPGS